MKSGTNTPADGNHSSSGDGLTVTRQPNETDEAALARLAYDTAARAVCTGRKFLAPVMGERRLQESHAAISHKIAKVKAGDLSEIEKTLVVQADTLDAMFNEMARRAALNAGEHLHATEIYTRLALKAQSQCRATLETLANIKNPPLVIARQANFANGPQQVNNGGRASGLAHAGNSEIEDQSHALGQADLTSGLDARSGKMLSYEQAITPALQGTRGQGAACLPHARSPSRRADGKG